MKKAIAIASAVLMLMATIVAFSQGASAEDTTPPAVTSVTPNDGAVDISATSIQPIYVKFSEIMEKSSTESAFSLTGPTGSVQGSFSWGWGGSQLIFTPSEHFQYSTVYTISVGAGAKDLTGNTLATPFTSTFTTVVPQDTHPPTIEYASDQIVKDVQATPYIMCGVRDYGGSGVDASSVKVTIDHRDVTTNAVVPVFDWGIWVEYPTAMLSQGDHTITVELDDHAGNHAVATWQVKVHNRDTK